jgi:hypothetical protein
MNRVLNQMPSVQRDMDERARRVLQKAKELAPRDTGNLANSLQITKTVEGNKVVFRIVSDDPRIREILKGTKGPYDSPPPWSVDSPLGQWGLRHGFTTNRARYTLARSVAIHGTNPAGSYRGQEDWIQEALREAIR